MKKSPIELINLSFSTLMVLLTITGFFVFLFTDLMSDRVFGVKRYILAIIFLAYALPIIVSTLMNNFYFGIIFTIINYSVLLIIYGKKKTVFRF